MRINSVSLYQAIYFKQSYEEKYRDKLFDLEDDDFTTYDDDAWGISYYDKRVTEALRNSILRNNNIINTHEFVISQRAENPAPIRAISDDSFAGEPLVYTPNRLARLKGKGLKRVIDLAGINNYESVCKTQGLDYYNFSNLPNHYDNPAFLTLEEYNEVVASKNNYGLDTSNCDYHQETRNYIDDFKKFISLINKGQFYIGCDHGLERTNFMLLMNDKFNPNWKGNNGLSLNQVEERHMKEFYKKLTLQDKKDLGFTDKFEDDLKEILHIQKDGI